MWQKAMNLGGGGGWENPVYKDDVNVLVKEQNITSGGNAAFSTPTRAKKAIWIMADSSTAGNVQIFYIDMENNVGYRVTRWSGNYSDYSSYDSILTYVDVTDSNVKFTDFLGRTTYDFFTIYC